MARVIGFFKGLVADGYKLVSLAAPVLSGFIALAKWQKWSVMEINFAEISWAWVFAPVTVWFFIAYLRRWQKYQTLETERNTLRDIRDYETATNELSVLFNEGNNTVLNPPVMADGEYAPWYARWVNWQNRVERHLEQHFGLREKNLFRNIVIVDTPELSGYSPQYIYQRRQVAKQLEILRDAIIRYSDRVQKWHAENT